LEFISHEATERRLTVSGTIWMGLSEESSSWSSCINAKKEELKSGEGLGVEGEPCRAPEREEMQERLLSNMRPNNNEAFSRNFHLNGQQSETVTGTLWRWKTNIHGSHTSCLPIWITHLAVRRNKFMLIPAGQYIGDRLSIFRGDKKISPFSFIQQSSVHVQTWSPLWLHLNMTF